MTSLALPLSESSEAVIQAHSRSFALAARWLAPEHRTRVTALYAWCRRADDAVDLAPLDSRPRHLAELRRELEALYAGRRVAQPGLRDVQRTFLECEVPPEYPYALLDGLEMDVVGEQPESREDLLLYCWRVAGVVGVMLCHVFGVSRAEARRHAAHLGMAMQLTNVCRDVLEDWERGRLYVPDELLELHGARSLRERLGQPLPREAATPLSRAIAQLLDEADVLYRSADAGFSALPFRAALGSRIARHVYAAIGHRLRATNCNPFAGRAVVPERTQGALAARAALETLEEWPAVALAEPVELRGTLEFRDVVA